MPSRIGFRVAKVTSEEEGMRGSQLVEVGPQAKVRSGAGMETDD